MTPHALAQVFKLHAGAIAGYARRLTDEHSAEDAVQESYVRILLYGRRGAHEIDLPYILLTIKNIIRRSARRGERMTTSAEHAIESAPVAREPAREEELPPGVSRSLAQLAPAHQESLILTCVHGLDCGRAAQSLGLPSGQVWRKRELAVRTLRRAAEDWLNRPVGGGRSQANVKEPAA